MSTGITLDNFFNLVRYKSLNEIANDVCLANNRDYVKVVRCGDCKHSSRNTVSKMVYCNGCSRGLKPVECYCADGEMRDEE